VPTQAAASPVVNPHINAHTQATNANINQPAHVPSSASILPGTSRLASLRDSLGAENNVIEMCDYSDGITEFGPIVGVRPCLSDNPRFNRCIVNTGTEDFPHHKILKGSDLCPGGAEVLSEQTELHTVFNLREKRQKMKTIPGFIRSVGPCTEMPRSDSYAPRPGAKARKLDAYVNVKYKTRHDDWLSRSEYSQLVGAKCADRHFSQL
jgi:hypothetical protein